MYAALPLRSLLKDEDRRLDNSVARAELEPPLGAAIT